MGHPVTHFQIEAKDDKAAAEFFAKLFNWKIEAVPNMPYHMIATGADTGIQGGIAKLDEGHNPGLTFYVEVPSVAESLAQAESLGAKVVQQPTLVMPGLTLGMFIDLEGRSIGLSTTDKPVQAAKPKAAKPKKTKKVAAKKGKKNKKAKKR